MISVSELNVFEQHASTEVSGLLASLSSGIAQIFGHILSIKIKTVENEELVLKKKGNPGNLHLDFFFTPKKLVWLFILIDTLVKTCSRMTTATTLSRQNDRGSREQY